MLNCASKQRQDVVALTVDLRLTKFRGVTSRKVPPDFPDRLESSNLGLTCDRDMLRVTRLRAAVGGRTSQLFRTSATGVKAHPSHHFNMF